METAPLCPVAGKPGKRVPAITVGSLVRADRLPEGAGCEWFFCDLPDCDVVYFAKDGRTLGKDALKVRVGTKEKTSPRPVCYCFGHTLESIRDEIERTGRSTVAASIAARVKAGECSCETKNPKGSCCLGDVNRVVKEAFAAIGPEQPRISHTPDANDEPSHGCCHVSLPDPGMPITPDANSAPSHDCCAVVPASPVSPPHGGAPSHADRAGLLATTASVLSALISSACCWLPLLLVAFGASAAGASAAFERARPIFLGVAPLFLGLGFYFAYFRKESCATDGTCTARAGRRQRFNRAMLWVATAVVLALAFFPSYVGLLFPRSQPPVAANETGPARTLTLRIEGMTCEACASHVESELVAVPGVRRAAVDYGAGRAAITVDASSPLESALLVEAVARAGYRAELVQER